MAINPTFKGILKDGKLTLERQQDFENHLRFLSTEKGTDITMVVKKYSKPRTNKQNSYYYAVVVPLVAEYTGYSNLEAHEALKFQMLLDRSGRLPIVGSTTDLSTTEMEAYLSNCRQWASAELGVYIPLPNETEFDYSLQVL